MSFFNSELVREEMDEISRLQDKVYQKVWEFPSMDKDDKLEHVEMLSELLDKQKVLYTRLSLSDDPEAKRMKEQIMQSAKSLGFPDDVDLTYVFSNMTKILDSMKKSIDNS
jgi:hypothetical protein